MDALVWVEAWEVQAEMLPFAVGQRVTWPVGSQFNERALTEHVGADTAARISVGVDYNALRPEDTVDYTGIVSRIDVYRFASPGDRSYQVRWRRFPLPKWTAGSQKRTVSTSLAIS